MVSLINFKIVNEDLQQQQQQQQRRHEEQSVESSEQMFVKVIQANQDQKIQQEQQLTRGQQVNSQTSKSKSNRTYQLNDKHNNLIASDLISNKPQSVLFNQAAQSKSIDLSPNFVVTWRNLKFLIEPKWHQKVMTKNNLNSFPCFKGNKLSRCQAGQQQAATLASSQEVVTKIVLDKLDGSFRSGELTAILGPSGAGKTTLLDCLTGHRKHGLSGSIRISSSSSSSAIFSNKFNNANAHNQQQSNDNLKVSIIPQNDHLMGHLTVYETLNYASKMKNCFENKTFNHKLNIKRIAQQLGLISCLETRINKLSGGQYKRVSIAQELLSSPDILILDEPTSGLDAMTCYQTVQVLRKLTDDEHKQNKQIAVILTIHQPNSDVFQQFNHVYVVAQGGKCIYEGSPGSIEQVINRIGLRLPNSYYNPATMIVEIAAGKFGLDAIHKLNEIQKKQYDFLVTSDEQNSTGDSAVDCTSSSSASLSSLSNENDQDEHDDDDADDDDDDGGGGGDNLNNSKSKSKSKSKQQQQQHLEELNNNSLSGGVGLINQGFVMETSVDSSNMDVVVIVPKGAQDADVDDGDTDSLDKTKTSHDDNNNEDCNNNEGRRKKRRRNRKRSGDEQQSPKMAICAPFGGGGGGRGGGGGGGGAGGREKRLKLNSLKAEQKFPFWRHTYLHFHRSWLSIIRDPMLCGMQLALHIIVPVMVSLVYGTNVGKPNACPKASPHDIMAYALDPTDSAALQLQEDLRTTLENIGYIFFKLYGIIFAAMTVTVLTFPLDMHVLVKEFRNGWYGLSSYFLGRTLADIPFQLTLPLLAMSLSYYATGQPYSYMQWRFLSITGILILSSLIAQSQGLLFGAILMDKMKAAVFVAPAATTPIILFAGFLVRTQSIPRYLRPLSNLSYLRYAIEACLISRYGFNQCECDPEMFNQTVPELPPIARSMLDYWLSSYKAQYQNQNRQHNESLSMITDTSDIETTTLAAIENESPDLFGKLMSSLAKANSFGRNITSCEQVVPYPMIDYDLKDSQLFSCFAILLFMLIFTRFLTFFIVCFKVKRKV